MSKKKKMYVYLLITALIASIGSLIYYFVSQDIVKKIVFGNNQEKRIQEKDAINISDPLMRSIIEDYIKDGTLPKDFMENIDQITEIQAQLLIAQYIIRGNATGETQKLNNYIVNGLVNSNKQSIEITTGKNNTLINGLKEGERIEESPTFAGIDRGYYSGGVKIGQWSEAALFYGMLKGNYVNGLKVGERIESNEFGVTTYNYISGSIEGISINQSSDGQKVYTTYKNNKPISGRIEEPNGDSEMGNYDEDGEKIGIREVTKNGIMKKVNYTP